MYPNLQDKAAFYMFSIVTGHIFQDGNKRTGLAASLLFLKLNSAKLQDSLERVVANAGRYIPATGKSVDEILENFTMEMAAGQITLDEARQWFAVNVELLGPVSAQQVLSP